MIVFVRTVRTVRGKRGEAKKWAIELTDYINAQCPEIQCKVFIPRFGEMNRIMLKSRAGNTEHEKTKYFRLRIILR